MRYAPVESVVAVWTFLSPASAPIWITAPESGVCATLSKTTPVTVTPADVDPVSAVVRDAEDMVDVCAWSTDGAIASPRTAIVRSRDIDPPLSRSIRDAEAPSPGELRRDHALRDRARVATAPA